MSAPELARLEPSEEAIAVELFAELLLDALRERERTPSAGPALIDEEEVEA